MNIRPLKKIGFVAALALALMLPLLANAQACFCSCSLSDGTTTTGCVGGTQECTTNCKDTKTGAAGTPTCVQDTQKCGAAAKPVTLPLPLGAISPAQAIGKVIKALIGLVGTLALVMFIYGGFLYMTSAGNEEQVTKGKNTLIWAILGLIAVFSAYSVVNFLVTRIGT